MIRSRLLLAAFEYLKDADTEEAAYAFRNLADEIEQRGCLEEEDLLTVVHNIQDLLDEE